ncbi:MAG: hypothetical protein QOI07_886 [Verrucomicrobiota bacterium]|jgi:hypothetical protein
MTHKQRVWSGALDADDSFPKKLTAILTGEKTGFRD